MAECAWVALVRDRDTEDVTTCRFRYLSFAPEEEAKRSLQRTISDNYVVLEVSTNPYKYQKYKSHV